MALGVKVVMRTLHLLYLNEVFTLRPREDDFASRRVFVRVFKESVGLSISPLNSVSVGFMCYTALSLSYHLQMSLLHVLVHLSLQGLCVCLCLSGSVSLE
jgi:hypothetical protein